MVEMRPIPTPFIFRWRRFIQNILPVIIFAVCVLLTLWLWDRQSQMGNAIGVVEATFVDVPSGTAGILMPPGHGEWADFQTVKRGEVIGTIRLAQRETFAAQLVTLQKEKEKIRADMVAARETFYLNMRQQYEGEWFDLARLYWRVEEFQLDHRDRRTRIRTAQAQLRRIQAELGFNEKTATRGAVSEQAIVDNRLEAKRLEELIKRETEAYLANRASYKREHERLVARRGMRAAQDQERSAEIQNVVRAITAPFDKQLDVLEARAGEVHAAQLDATSSMAVRAPVDGVVTEVFAVPGQAIQAGDPILRIASEKSDYVVSYVRHRQRIQPVRNMLVKLRTRQTGSRPIDSSIVEISPQVEPVPAQHLMDPTRPEWGTRVKIALPKEFRPLLRPGEQVDIIFPSKTKVARAE